MNSHTVPLFFCCSASFLLYLTSGLRKYQKIRNTKTAKRSKLDTIKVVVILCIKLEFTDKGYDFCDTGRGVRVYVERLVFRIVGYRLYVVLADVQAFHRCAVSGADGVNLAIVDFKHGRDISAGDGVAVGNGRQH